MKNYERINNLVVSCQNGCKKSLESLIDALSPLIKAKCKHYFGYVDEDLYSDGILRLIELINDFDFEKNTRFLGYIEYMISCFYWDKKRRQLKESSKEIIVDEYIEHIYEEDFSIIDIQDIFSILSDKEKYIIIENVLNKDTLVNISKDLNISYKYAKLLKSRAIRKLHTLFSKSTVL
ncbi:RNA polymerase sporulation-specific sigma factor [Alkalithermobacter thermoalcaliphilus JW-YL-7 = DSM 7308]|uniref:RNA polymerase sigma factor, sigma-70 family n=1 Tax=Alkalithermobacter thermoalcaliphilus JW-YL-7 = DSM 7308 TaxID=1121328 RepID=A0A150FSG0_CLOPD|nr:RNA polymerase sigma factor, sigma-70 family [[Clostridium] paradoxum JW-YL-7 = DSM 7308]SHK70629.1 RNA polymerase sporulation-specific sigma factor [[Clostridium] paradoxum JW-YL-7 = DSM 7308]